VEMEMAVVPLEILEAKMISIPMDDVIQCFDSLMQTNKYARVVVYPTIKKATIWTANPVASREAAVANGAKNNSSYANFRNNEEKAMLESYLDLCNENAFEEADRVLEGVLESQIQRLKHYVGQYNHVLCLERNNGIPHADIEMNFSYEKHKEVLQKVFDHYENNRLPYYNFEIRTTNQDDAFLSCCQSRPGMWIDFQAKADISHEFFYEMTSMLKQFGYRKHWAKGMDNSDPRYVIEQFPDIAKFIEAVKFIDPTGKFRNEEGELWFQALDIFSQDCNERKTITDAAQALACSNDETHRILTKDCYEKKIVSNVARVRGGGKDTFRKSVTNVAQVWAESQDIIQIIMNKNSHLKRSLTKIDSSMSVIQTLDESETEVEGVPEEVVKKESAMVEEPNNDCLEPLPATDKHTSLSPHIESAPASTSRNPVPVVMISDPGQDLDDEMMFIMSSHLHALGLISVRGVIANLHPSLARARLTRGTFDLLGLRHVPVGIGTDGGDNSGNHSSKQFESTSSSYIIKEDDEEAMETLEPGHELLQRLYQAAPDIEYVDTVEVGTNGESVKREIKGGLTIVVTSSFKDISIFVRDNPKVFASKTREVVVMGGCEPVLATNGDECEPDSANNNTFDQEASAHFYSTCQQMNVTLTVVSRHSAYAAKMPRSVYDDLAITGSAIGLRLRNSQRAGIDQLWQRASSADPSVRKGLPPRCNREWFINTFCGGNDDPKRSEEDSVWDLVTGFMQYDTLALLASVPGVREALFDPTVLPPLSHGIQGDKNSTVDAFDTGTRNLIGVSALEHGLKEPSLIVQLLKTGYQQGLLRNHNVE